MKEEKAGRNRLSASFVTGAIALAFLVTGYQTALFVHRAAVERIVADRDEPDTVFVYGDVDGELALGQAEREVGGLSGNRTRRGEPAGGSRKLKSFSGRGVAARMERKGSSHPPVAQAVRLANPPKRVESFRFDPNTASLEDFQRLGFSARQAEAIDRYRQKGGRFRRASDFAKSYAVEDSVYQRLEPFIDIPLVDINKADSSAFDTLPGIGPYFAAKMVEYREKLGGYSYKEQLMDIYNFDEEKFAALEDLVTVGPHRPYRLWSLPEDSLKMHPYIGKFAAHGIIVYRENNPAEKLTVDGLAAAGVISPEFAAKLRRCDVE